jgi:hypothetical protein
MQSRLALKGTINQYVSGWAHAAEAQNKAEIDLLTLNAPYLRGQLIFEQRFL